MPNNIHCIQWIELAGAKRPGKDGEGGNGWRNCGGCPPQANLSAGDAKGRDEMDQE